MTLKTINKSKKIGIVVFVIILAFSLSFSMSMYMDTYAKTNSSVNKIIEKKQNSSIKSFLKNNGYVQKADKIKDDEDLTSKEKIKKLTIPAPKNNGYGGSVKDGKITDGYIVMTEDGSMKRIDKAEDASKVAKVDDIALIMPNTIVRATNFPKYDPNDPLFVNQKELDISPTGINADLVHKMAGLSGNGKYVAVIDTGVSAIGDLNGQVVKGVNIIDSRLSNYNMSDVITLPTSDGAGHGTYVASQIAAKTNNGEGMASTAYNSKIVPIKTLDSKGEGALSELLNGLIAVSLYNDGTLAKYNSAYNHKIDVVNMSVGYSEPKLSDFDSQAEYDKFMSNFNEFNNEMSKTINSITNQGTIVVAASGNDGENSKNLNATSYPAAFNNVIGVGSYNTANGNISSYSTANSTVDVCAPGENVYGMHHINGSYSKNMRGTSMATPMVSAVAALYKEKYPSSKTSDFLNRIQTQLNTDTDCINDTAGWDKYYGYGHIDAGAILGVTADTSLYPPSNLKNHLIPSSFYYGGGSKVYDGNTPSISVSGPSGVSFAPYASKAGDVYRNKVDLKNAGTYDIYVNVPETTLYYGLNGLKVGTYTINRKPLTASNTKLSTSSFVYGYSKKTGIYYGSTKLSSASDYDYKWSTSTSVGYKYLSLAFTGNYSGSAKELYKIVPKKGYIKKIQKSSKKRTIKVSFTSAYYRGIKNSGGITQVAYKKAGGKWHYKYVKYKTASKTLTKLSKGKKYYFKVRSYLKVKGKSTIWGKWSTIKSVKL